MGRPAIKTLPAESKAADASRLATLPDGNKDEIETTTTPIVAELIPKDQKDYTKEEREIQKLRVKIFSVCNDAMSYLHDVARGAEKGNRTRMRACESFIRFLPELDKASSSQPLHLHLDVPRPNRKA